MTIVSHSLSRARPSPRHADHLHGEWTPHIKYLFSRKPHSPTIVEGLVPDLLPSPAPRMPCVVFEGGSDYKDRHNHPDEPFNIQEDYHKLLATIRAERLFWPVSLTDAKEVDILVVGNRLSLPSRALLQQIKDQHPSKSVAVLSDGAQGRSPLVRAASEMGIEVFNSPAIIRVEALQQVYGNDDSRIIRWAQLAEIQTYTTFKDRNKYNIHSDTDLLAKCVCFDPWERKRINLERAIEILIFLRNFAIRNRRPTMTFGMSRWKFSIVRPFLAGPDPRSKNCRTLDEALYWARRTGGRVGAWGNRKIGIAEAQCAAAGIDLVRIEDGFLRSVGLGLQRAPASSLVVDEGVNYFDSSRPSALESIIQTTEFTPALTERARQLRCMILARRLTKYNISGHDPLPDVRDRIKVLVPGQVEGDQSLAFGSPKVRTNQDLLLRARALNPDGFILFKPHPDVLTGLRPGTVESSIIAEASDAVVTHASMADCLDWADRVETMTSLTGFEALLRNKTTSVHGLPFYAGWGLTIDSLRSTRRQRLLSIDELVAAALILYPQYVDPVTRLPAEPELVVRRLDEIIQRAPSPADAVIFAYRATVSFVVHKVFNRFQRKL